jgi:hypothetical protein
VLERDWPILCSHGTHDSKSDISIYKEKNLLNSWSDPLSVSYDFSCADFRTLECSAHVRSQCSIALFSRQNGMDSTISSVDNGSRSDVCVKSVGRPLSGHQGRGWETEYQETDDEPVKYARSRPVRIRPFSK